MQQNKHPVDVAKLCFFINPETPKVPRVLQMLMIFYCNSFVTEPEAELKMEHSQNEIRTEGRQNANRTQTET